MHGYNFVGPVIYLLYKEEQIPIVLIITSDPTLLTFQECLIIFRLSNFKSLKSFWIIPVDHVQAYVCVFACVYVCVRAEEEGLEVLFWFAVRYLRLRSHPEESSAGGCEVLMAADGKIHSQHLNNAAFR